MLIASKLKNEVSSELDSLVSLYKILHATPELSGQEKNTSELLVGELELCGIRVERNVGGYGIIGYLENGEGPTIVVRTDMDALPITEDSGVDYASHVSTKDVSGKSIPAMHACGHDIHMSSFIGTARVVSKFKEDWTGRIIFVGQPAEETLSGAKSMINDGLFERFGVPDACLAMHVFPRITAGHIAVKYGLIWAGAFELKITVYGVGGHGASPHLSKDPIVLAARIVTSLQTIVSRELSPLTPAVVTVGAINGGSRANIIPDEVVMKVTARFIDEETRNHILDSIKRICRYEAQSMGIPEHILPVVEVNAENEVPPLVNDSALSNTIKESALELYDQEYVEDATEMLMVSEDFALFKNWAGEEVPCSMFFVGADDSCDKVVFNSKESLQPSLHNCKFAPPPAPVISAAVSVMSATVLNLLAKK